MDSIKSQQEGSWLEWLGVGWQENDILEACEIADRLGLIRPIVEQSQYNLFSRSTVEVEYAALYKKYKLGLTIWSPLASGVLTGKYAKGLPDESRLGGGVFWQKLSKTLLGMEVSTAAGLVEKLRPIAEELNCSLAELALAWTLLNDNVTTVLLGAKTLAQLNENLQAYPITAKITPEIKARIESSRSSTRHFRATCFA